MKTKKSNTVLAIFLMLLIIIAALWFIYYRENIKEVVQTFRQRRSSNETEAEISTTTSSSMWVSKMMEEKLNNSQIREEENVLATSLAKLLISTPEDIMKFLTDENFGCKKINRSLNTFRKNFNGDLSADNTYVKLFRSLAKFYNLICGQNEMYRKLFAPSQDEIGKMHDQLAFCAGELDWYEKNATKACAEGQKILNCYHEALVYDVGEKVAYYYHHIFKHVINSALSHPCKFDKLPLSFKDSLDSAGRRSNPKMDHYLLAVVLLCGIIL